MRRGRGDECGREGDECGSGEEGGGREGGRMRKKVRE